MVNVFWRNLFLEAGFERCFKAATSLPSLKSLGAGHLATWPQTGNWARGLVTRDVGLSVGLELEWDSPSLSYDLVPGVLMCGSWRESSP